MKTKIINITISTFLVIVLFACNSANKKPSTGDNVSIKNDTVQERIVEQNQSIEEKSELLKTLIELTNSDAFKTRTATDYEWNTIGETESSAYEIIKQKDNDYIVLYVWQMIGKEDTLVFQMLEKTTDYTTYAYNENGKTESPFTYHSGFSVFKRNKSGLWKLEEQSIIENSSNAGIMGIFEYKPEIKTLFEYKKEYTENEGFAGELKSKYTWSNSNKCFEEMKPDLPNPILIKGGGYEEAPFCNSYFRAPIDIKYYHNNQTADKTEIDFAYTYTSLKDNKTISVNDKTMADIINNSDTKARILIKYKKDKIHECDENSKYFETEANIIEDYEIVSKSPVTAIFTSYESGDFEYYEFTSPLGYKFYFNDFADYTYSFINENGDGPNPKYRNKKFKIWFHSKLIDNEFGGEKFKMMIIDKIEEQK